MPEMNLGDTQTKQENELRQGAALLLECFS